MVYVLTSLWYIAITWISLKRRENSSKTRVGPKQGGKHGSRVISYLIVRLLGRVRNFRSGSRTCRFLQYKSIHSLIILWNEHIDTINTLKSCISRQDLNIFVRLNDAHQLDVRLYKLNPPAFNRENTSMVPFKSEKLTRVITHACINYV